MSSFASLVGAGAGCVSPPASGVVCLGKFSADSRRLVYEDARYPVVYLYDLPTRQRFNFPGRIIAVDEQMRRFLLCEWYGIETFGLSLVTVADDGKAQAVNLPDVKCRCPRQRHQEWAKESTPRYRQQPYCHAVTGDFTADDIQIALRELANYRLLRLNVAANTWDEVESGPRVETPESWHNPQPPPGGFGESTETCYLVGQGRSYAVKDGKRFIARSPDGISTVQAQGGYLPWREVSIIGPGGGRETLLENSHAVAETAENTALIAAWPVIWPVTTVILLINPPPP